MTTSGDPDLRSKREKMREDSRRHAEAIITLSGFVWKNVWELANGYWPDSPHYDDVRTPWWLFWTGIGPIRIGTRKRVIEIDWSATDVRGIVTADDVTKSDTYVHAWSHAKAIEYVSELKRLASR